MSDLILRVLLYAACFLGWMAIEAVLTPIVWARGWRGTR